MNTFAETKVGNKSNVSSSDLSSATRTQQHYSNADKPNDLS